MDLNAGGPPPGTKMPDAPAEVIARAVEAFGGLTEDGWQSMFEFNLFSGSTSITAPPRRA
jgi:hypothetical protein